MNDFEILTNNRQKLIKSLKIKKNREEEGLFFVEGIKLCEELLNSKSDFIDFLVLPGNAGLQAIEVANDYLDVGIPVYKIERRIFDTLCDTKSPQDLLAVSKFFDMSVLTEESFIGLEAIADPGNLGTIIRTADWFGFRQILLDENCADIYNPKTVRASMGSIFRMNLISETNLLDGISKHFGNHLLIGTTLHSNIDLSYVEVKKNTGIIFGNESRGISEELKKKINTKVSIKGFGDAESLNVSIASGIVLYEISRKLNFLNS